MTQHLLTLDQFQKVLPTKTKKLVTQTTIDNINGSLNDPLFAEQFRENILGYSSVLEDGRFKVEDYVNAVKYVSYKTMGDTNIKAYTKTFPDRYQAFLNNGTSEKDIASYVTSYNKNKLVQLIKEQSIVPFYVYNADARQKALDHQLRLMVTAKSEKVQQDAANSVLTHTKPPETSKIELDVGVKDSDAIKELREATLELVAEQRKAIQAGVATAKSTAHSKVIEGECEVIDES